MRGDRRQTSLDRASARDLTTLATDRGPVPMNIGVVMVLDGPDAIDFRRFISHMAERVPTVPRLRQRLVPVPPGLGRPIWVDDPGFDLTRHLQHKRLPGTATHRDVLDIAADLVCQRLDRRRPLWAATFVTGGADHQASVILVLHHVVADGLGGLALLGALVDGYGRSNVRPFPVPPPSRRMLAADVFRERRSAALRVPQRLGEAVDGLREIGMSSRPKAAERISLNRPTGASRRLTTVNLDLAAIQAAARREKCTVNDIVLTAISGCLIEALHRRGEHPDRLVISVPIAARRVAQKERLGNEVGAVPVVVPTLPDWRRRLSAVAAQMRARRQENRGSSAVPLSLLFRTLGRLGLAQAFVDHQRLVHTFETNMPGPQVPLTFAGTTIGALIPVAVNPGNVSVSFDVLSYAGRLVVTVVADPTLVPEQDHLTSTLAEEFSLLAQ